MRFQRLLIVCGAFALFIAALKGGTMYMHHRTEISYNEMEEAYNAKQGLFEDTKRKFKMLPAYVSAYSTFKAAAFVDHYFVWLFVGWLIFFKLMPWALMKGVDIFVNGRSVQHAGDSEFHLDDNGNLVITLGNLDKQKLIKKLEAK